jgi:alanine racemase
MSRPARALLDPAALRHNLEQVKRHAPRARVMAVVKANGYGHGLAWVASALKQADAFAVASIDEGLLLRASGITQPIVLLEGFFDADELALLNAKVLAPVLHHAHQLALLEANPARVPHALWIKLDTGMHRVGFAPQEFPAVLARIRKLPGVREIRVLTHFANADVPSDSLTARQIETFRTRLNGQRLETSLANSAGIIAWPDSHGDWVRPGIMLYGSSPFADRSAATLDLKPVMTLETGLMAVHTRRRGEAIGYGGDYRCPEDMPVGVAAIGYGDGYPRHAPAGTPVLVNGHAVPLIGRVSMDMITLDLRTQPQARIGDRVVLWGQGLPVDDIARCAGTISYELLCHVAERIPRVTPNHAA